ncbi:MAG: hypothetical protein Q4F41_12980 [Eubacteriales bacterium]|nr:hypothetical protein [Eubacteriales bacterium]
MNWSKIFGGITAAFFACENEQIRTALRENSNLSPAEQAAKAILAAAIVRGLILTVSHQEQIGALYPKVLEMLVYGARRELFDEN